MSKEVLSFIIVPPFGQRAKSYMCEEPRRWLLQDIADACGQFDLIGKRSFAA